MRLREALAVLPLVLGIALAGSAHGDSLAGTLGTNIVPFIAAGAPQLYPPDAREGRADLDLTAWPSRGVITLNIRYDGASLICSATSASIRTSWICSTWTTRPTVRAPYGRSSR